MTKVCLCAIATFIQMEMYSSHVMQISLPAMEESRSLGRLALSLDSAEVCESGASILWHSVIRPRHKLEV